MDFYEYQREILANPHPDFYQDIVKRKPYKFKDSDVKPIAFYLPQFHPFPENDKWWGKGFTEWTNVSKALPRFEGHYQPHLPGELGFYNLLTDGVMERQIELAQMYGIYGFCFYFYMFDKRKRLLERPLNKFLRKRKLDIPFCLCYANENWSRNWDGQEKSILIRQSYDKDFIKDLAYEMRDYVNDPRYIRIDDKPLIVIYRLNLLPNYNGFASSFREECKKNGIGEIYLASVLSFDNSNAIEFGFDDNIEFPPQQVQHLSISKDLQFFDFINRGSVLSYPHIVITETEKQIDFPRLRGVMPNWDNEARRTGQGTTFFGSTPKLYQYWLQTVCGKTINERPESQRFVFINSWNEWAEGNHLEPDKYYGYAYLEATYQAMFNQKILPLSSSINRLDIDDTITANIRLNIGRIQLYYDTGKGYNEQESIVINVNNYKGTQKIEFELSNIDNLKSLRLDPIDNIAICTIDTLKINDSAVAYDLLKNLKTNAVIIDNNTFYFQDSDPQIIIGLKGIDSDNLKTLIATLTYHNIGIDALYECANKLSSISDNQQAHINNLESAASHMKSHIAELTDRCNQQQAHINDRHTHINNLESAISHMKTHIAELTDRCNQQELHINDRHTHINNLESAISHMKTHIAELTDRCNQQELHINDRHTHINNLESAVSHMKNHIAELTELCNQQTAELQKIYHSKGWKLLSIYYKISPKAIPYGSFRRKTAVFAYNTFKPIARFSWRSLKFFYHFPSELKTFFSLKKNLLKSEDNIKNLPLKSEDNIKISQVKQRTFYVYINRTVSLNDNTGLERVTRMLSRSLIELNFELRFVKWDKVQKSLVFINCADLEHLGKWSGPNFNEPDTLFYKNNAEKTFIPLLRSWLIIPEIPYITGNPEDSILTKDIIQSAKDLELKTAFVFYDDIPLHRPELSSVKQKHSDYMEELLSADLIFPISLWSSHNLIEFYKTLNLYDKTTEGKIKPLPLPAEIIGIARRTDPILALKHKKLILSVGSITIHKNQLTLIKAFNEYCDNNKNTDWKLILAGNIASDIKDEINRLVKNNSKIVITNHISDEQLHEYYSNCAFTVFPSVEEGFGLPIAESLWFGKPCICADFGAMAELGRLPGCVEIDTANQGLIRDAITKLINNPKYLEDLALKAAASPLHTWDKYTKDLTDSLYENRTIFIDVTELAKNDAGTGIQRVTRSLAKYLLLAPPDGYDVKLVKISSEGAYYIPAVSLTAKLMGRKEINDKNIEISCNSKDIFFALDLVPEIIFAEDWIRKQKIKNVIIAFLVYDLIPYRNPEFVVDGTKEAWFDKYLSLTKEMGDEIICISKTTSLDYKKWINENYPGETFCPNISYIHLGAEPHERNNHSKISEEVSQKTDSLKDKLNFLMVGTLEPRKGYRQVLEAFEVLWKNDIDIRLIIVGNIGWKSEDLVHKISSHRELNHRLFWFKGADDFLLQKLYSLSKCLIAASYNEGFGLPIIEASLNKLYVLARDISIFREVAGNNASYFDASDSISLAAQINKWITAYQNNKVPLPGNISYISWDECGRKAAAILKNTALCKNLLSQKTLVSIIIPVHNKVELTRQCLDSIYAHSATIPFEIIVVNDASTDDTVQYLNSIKHNNFRFINNSSNLRFAESCNAGARIANGNLLLFLNNDTVVEKYWLEPLTSRALGSITIGIVGAKLLYPNRTIQHCGLSFIDGIVKAHVSPIHRLRHEPCDNPESMHPLKLAAVTGACLMIKKALFNEVGGFEESYGMYYEDVDLCFKIMKLGFEVIYEPSSTILHLERQSFDSSVDKLLASAILKFNSRWAAEVANLGELACGVIYQPVWQSFEHSEKRPTLSICITTYNRADWLQVNLTNILKLLGTPHKEVEIVVCDNASTDHTDSIMQKFLYRTDIKYVRNPKNVGMLGNLHETAIAASGQYIWLIGDDDLLIPDSIEKILSSIKKYPSVALIYLNFFYTQEKDPHSFKNIETFITLTKPIEPPTPDLFGKVSEIAACSDNFFTAIYCIIFRRDHALKVYSQNTDGPPFSSMITCIPTTHYVLNKMMSEPALWIGTPQIVGNLNNSWMSYAPLWILERMPEVFDLAELRGADKQLIDNRRKQHLPHMKYWFPKIYDDNSTYNLKYFDIRKMLRRIEHLPEFPEYLKYFKMIYTDKYNLNRHGAEIPPEEVFNKYNNMLTEAN